MNTLAMHTLSRMHAQARMHGHSHTHVHIIIFYLLLTNTL